MSIVIESEGITLIWVIENFKYSLQQNDRSLDSPVFTIDSLNASMWKLKLYPRGNNQKTDGIGYFLHNVKLKNQQDIALSGYQLSILANNGSPLVSKKCESQQFTANTGYGYTSFCSRDEVFKTKGSSYLPQDALTARCFIWMNGTEISKPEQHFARTRIGIERKAFTWIIKKFSSLQPQKKRTIHVEPTSKQMPSLIFTLSLSDDESVQIEIKHIDLKQDYLATYKVCALDRNGKVICFGENEFFIDLCDEYKVYRLPQFLTKSRLLTNNRLYLPNDILSLKCECVVSVGVVSNEIEDYGKYSNETVNAIVSSDNYLLPIVSKTTLIKDLQSLYDERKFCEVTLRTGDTNIPVHKAVLCARSSVFRAMFENDTVEKANNVVEISDVNARTLEEMLYFMYHDTVEDLQWKSAPDLYFAADKYNIPVLKRICSSFLKTNLNFQNIFETLALADRHNDDDLKATSESFILRYGSEIISSEEWKLFEKNNLQLAVETLKHLFSKTIKASR